MPTMVQKITLTRFTEPRKRVLIIITPVIRVEMLTDVRMSGIGSNSLKNPEILAQCHDFIPL